MHSQKVYTFFVGYILRWTCHNPLCYVYDFDTNWKSEPFKFIILAWRVSFLLCSWRKSKGIGSSPSLFSSVSMKFHRQDSRAVSLPLIWTTRKQKSVISEKNNKLFSSQKVSGPFQENKGNKGSLRTRNNVMSKFVSSKSHCQHLLNMNTQITKVR